MKCRNCGNEIKIWHGWELCDKCEYRHHVESKWHDNLDWKAKKRAQVENKEKNLSAQDREERIARISYQIEQKKLWVPGDRRKRKG